VSTINATLCEHALLLRCTGWYRKATTATVDYVSAMRANVYMKF